jgi:hypothetical protein
MMRYRPSTEDIKIFLVNVRKNKGIESPIRFTNTPNHPYKNVEKTIAR